MPDHRDRTDDDLPACVNRKTGGASGDGVPALRLGSLLTSLRPDEVRDLTTAATIALLHERLGERQPLVAEVVA